jgi:phosphatidylglycerophosphate synthase
VSPLDAFNKYFIGTIRDSIIAVVRALARPLNSLTGGKLHPDAVTIFGTLMHLPIAWLIATAHPVRAAVLLIFFGLFDKLDGELARLQKRASVRGMLLDASTDRIKEVMLYTGIVAFYAYHHGPMVRPQFIVWAVIALGASLCVSYVKAKGEAAIAANGIKLSHSELNKLFADGIFMFEVRMVMLIIGLLSGYLAEMLILIALFSGGTAIMRLIRISRKL